MTSPKTPPFATLKRALPPTTQIVRDVKESAPFAVKVPYPHRDLWPNARPHWAAKSRAVRKARNAAGFATLAALNGRAAPKWERVRVSSVWWMKDMRGMDADRDNRIASLKASIDGLCDAGLILNDRGVEWGPVETGGVDAAEPGVVLTVEVIRDVQHSCNDCAA